MKTTIIKYAAAVLAISLFSCGEKKDGKELSLKVYGNCEMCKKTIEGSVKDTKGVNFAEWNEKTKMMSVYYDTTKTNKQEIEKQVAAAGYDTETEKGNDAAYSKLPECCQYDRKK